jgi:Transposase IS116/IS110/IS902 family
MGDVSRFARGEETARYLRLTPREHSSGGRQNLGVIMRAFATINFIESRVASPTRAFDLLLIEAITADYKYLLLCTSQLRDQRLKATPFRNH